MKKRGVLKKDLLFAAVAAAIIAALWLAPSETTLRIPDDDTHRVLAAVLERQGKKAAEDICRTCHNDQDMPLSKDHPPKYRCLFCHKFSEPQEKKKE